MSGLFETPSDILARRRASLQQSISDMRSRGGSSRKGDALKAILGAGLAWKGKFDEDATKENLGALGTALEGNTGREVNNQAFSDMRAQDVEAIPSMAPSQGAIAADKANIGQDRSALFAGSGLSKEMQGAARTEDIMSRGEFSQEGLLKSAQAVYAHNPKLAFELAAKANSMQGVAKKPMSPAGKQAFDEDLTVGTPEFVARVKEIEGGDTDDDDSRYKTVGNSIFDIKTQEWLVNPKKGSNISSSPIKTVITQAMVDTLDDVDQSMLGKPSTVLVDKSGVPLAAFAAQPNNNISSKVEGLQIESLESENKARMDERRVSETINSFKGIPDFGGGLALSFENTVKDNAGWRDAKSAAITQAKGFRAENAMKYLPPGPASDKDVALALSGQPDENAGKAEWVSYLTGIQKINRLETNYFTDRTNFISNHNGISGFSQQQEAKRIDVAILNQVARPDGETHYSLYHKMPSDSQFKEAARKAFKQDFGFDPDRPAVLRQALDNLGI